MLKWREKKSSHVYQSKYEKDNQTRKMSESLAIFVLLMALVCEVYLNLNISIQYNARVRGKLNNEII